MSSMTLDMKKFNMRDIKFSVNNPKTAEGPVIILIGKRGTGKSILIRDILFYHQDIPIGTVISGTEDANSFFSTLVPGTFIHGEYNSLIVSKMLDRQRSVLGKVNNDMTEYGRTQVDPRAFLILDDCIYDSSWARDKIMRAMFCNGRHFRVMLIITMQYPLGIPPNLRTNIDYTFILRENILSNRKRIYDNYAGMFPTFELFCKIMDQCTQNHECLVINNQTDSNAFTDQVFWYKANMDHPKFRLGAAALWESAKKMDNSNPYDPSKFMKRGSQNQPNITVRRSG